MDKKYFVIDKIILSRTNLILSRTNNVLSRTKNIFSGQMDRVKVQFATQTSCVLLRGTTDAVFTTNYNKSAVEFTTLSYMGPGIKPWTLGNILLLDVGTLK